MCHRGDRPRRSGHLDRLAQRRAAVAVLPHGHHIPGPELILVAKGWEGLVSGSLTNAINRTEMGDPIAPDAWVWSNTGIDGKTANFDAEGHCNSWDSSVGTGNRGDPTINSAGWTDALNPGACDSLHHLYCVQN